MIKHPRSILPILLLAVAALMAVSCFDSTQKEDVELTLSTLPSGVDSVRITVVNFNDTSIVYETIWEASALPPNPFRISVGSAAGKNWLVNVQGFQNGYLVYHVLVPSDVNYPPDHLNVTSGWPTVAFTAATLDTTGTPDSVKLMTAFRNVPSGIHWHLVYSPTQYDVAYASWLNVGVTTLQPLKWVVADLHMNGSHALLPVQVPDSMLVREALSPAGSTVRITEAYLDVSDTVHLILALGNFTLPTLDSTIPGEGVPMVHDIRGLRLLPNFHHMNGNASHVIGPASDLSGVDTLVVALHYATGQRIRPPAQYALPAASALRLRSTLPTLNVSGHWINATDTNLLDVTLAQTNYTGLHTHFYRNAFGDPQYQTCDLSTCFIQARVWKGASAVVVAVHVDGTHNPLMPLVLDTLLPPF